MKRAIIDEVIQLIRKIGGRFVCLKDNVWSIIPVKACRLKIAHAIQHHIRNEFRRDVHIPASSNLTSDIIREQSDLEEPLSDHERYVMDMKAKISLLNMQTGPHDIPTSCNSTGNHLPSSNLNSCRSDLLLNGGGFGTQKGNEVQSRNPKDLGYPFLEQHAAAFSFISNYDVVRNDQHANIYTGPTTSRMFLPELPRYFPAWMNQDTHAVATTPRPHAEVDMNRLPESTQFNTAQHDLARIHKESALLPVVTDMIDPRKRNSSTIHSHHDNQLVEPRIPIYSFENIQALENMYGLRSLNEPYESHNYHDIGQYAIGMDVGLSLLHCSGAGQDVFNMNGPSVIGWNSKSSEPSFDFLEDHKVPHVPTFEDVDDFECASFDLSSDSDVEEA